MYAMVIEHGDGNLEFHKRISFQRVMELEDLCERQSLSYFTFDAGEPVRDASEELNLNQQDISRHLDMEWASLASL